MAFNQDKSNKSKNQFAARMVSRATQATISWVHPVDDFARKVCGVTNMSEVTAEQAQAYLPKILDSTYAYVVVTDMTVDREQVSVLEY